MRRSARYALAWSAGAAAISAPTFGRIGRRTSISGTSEPAVGVCLLTEPGMAYPAASLALREKMTRLGHLGTNIAVKQHGVSRVIFLEPLIPFGTRVFVGQVYPGGRTNPASPQCDKVCSFMSWHRLDRARHRLCGQTT
jgi:hypothetical protein